MPTTSKTITDRHARNAAMDILAIESNPNFTRMNNQAFGTICTDADNRERLVEVRFIVHSFSEEKDADDILQEYVDKYEAAQEKARAQAEKKAEKAKKDAEKRAAQEDANND